MLITKNKKIACKPIELKKSLLLGSISAITDRNLLCLEVLYPDDSNKYCSGDKIYLSKDLENSDNAIWLKTVCLINGEPFVLIPEEFIIMHETK